MKGNLKNLLKKDWRRFGGSAGDSYVGRVSNAEE